MNDSEAIPILEGFSTQSFHQFKVPIGNTFDDPITPEGKVWRGAVKSLSEVDGWSAAWWGRREECIEEVGLILGIFSSFSFDNFLSGSPGHWIFPYKPRSIKPLTRSSNTGWKDYNKFESFFLSPAWTSFSETIAPLCSNSLITQYAVQLSPSVMTGISAWPEGQTSIYHIQFPTLLSLPERNKCELSVFSFVQCLHNRPSESSLEAARFKGGAAGWAIPLPISGKKGEQNASETGANIQKSIFVILMSWKDDEAEKEGEALTEPSMDEGLYEHHIQPMIRRAGPGAIKSHLKLDFLSEYNLKFEERSSVLLGMYWDDVKTGINKNLLDKAPSKNEYPEEAQFSSESNESSSSDDSTSGSDESDVEEILRTHPPPGTYSPLIERKRDSPDNSSSDSSSEEEEEVAESLVSKGAGQKNSGDKTSPQEPGARPEPVGREFT